jgi:hypothetical protein
MVESSVPPAEDKPIIVASMFGNTTPCVEAARAILEKAGFEVLVFHATGSGGPDNGEPDRGATGCRRAGRDHHRVGRRAGWRGDVRRSDAARGSRKDRHTCGHRTGLSRHGQFLGPETIPERLAGRRLYRHNEKQTLVRTTPEENEELGRIIAGKLNASTGPVEVFFAARNLGYFCGRETVYWPEADTALLESLQKNLRKDIAVHVMDCHINDAPFAEALAKDCWRCAPACELDDGYAPIDAPRAPGSSSVTRITGITC